MFALQEQCEGISVCITEYWIMTNAVNLALACGQNHYVLVQWNFLLLPILSIINTLYTYSSFYITVKHTPLKHSHMIEMEVWVV